MIVGYIAYDDVTKTEWYVSDYDKTALKAMADGGIRFFSVDTDRRRKEVPWDEVLEPTLNKTSEVLPVITTVLFSKVMEPILDSLQALEAKEPIAPIAKLSTQNNQPIQTPHYDAARSAYEEVMALFNESEVK